MFDYFTICVILYLLEILIYFIWYYKIVKIEMPEKNLFKRTLRILQRDLLSCFKIGINFIILDESEEVLQIKKWFNNFICNIMSFVPCFMGFLVITPLVLSIFFIQLNQDIGVIPGLTMSFIFLLNIQWDYLKSYSKQLLEILLSFKKIVLFMENNPKFIDRHQTGTRNIHKKSLFFLFLIYILAFIIVSRINYIQINYKKETFLLAVISLGYIFLIEPIQSYKKKKKYAKKEKHVTILCFELLKYENIINSMCQHLGIDDLEIDIIQENTINAYSIYRSGYTPSIFITSEMLNWLGEIWLKDNNFDIDNIIKLILGHELVHIKYKDAVMIQKSAQIASVVLLGGYFFIFGILYISTINKLFTIFLLPMLLIEFFFGNIISDKRYWGQISELRADKIGMLIANISYQTFETFWSVMGKEEREEERTEKLNQENILYKYYKRYIEIEYHPSIKRRKEVVAKVRRWGILDYIEQVIFIWKNKLLKKGWNGR